MTTEENKKLSIQDIISRPAMHLTSKTVIRALELGALAGIRATIPQAVASDYLSKHPDPTIALSSLKFLQSPVTAKITKLLSGAEITGDKFRDIPKRIAFPQLLARIASGSLIGAVIFLVNKEKAGKGIVIGGTSALAATFLSFFGRKYLSKIPYVKNYMVGILEDILAIRLGISFMKR